jgi:hypothetical protein
MYLSKAIVVLSLVPAWGVITNIAWMCEAGQLNFNDYPASLDYHVARPVRIQTEAEMVFRTRLLDASKEAANFAGHYVVTSWGCGTGCTMGAVIDKSSGDVIWLPGTICCTFDDLGYDVQPLSYRLKSYLLVLNGRIDEKADSQGAHYYLIKGDVLVHIGDSKLSEAPNVPGAL